MKIFEFRRYLRSALALAFVWVTMTVCVPAEAHAAGLEWFKGSLNANQKIVYETILNSTVTKDGKGAVDIVFESTYTPAGDDLNTACFALTRDHPELFWLKSDEMSFSWKVQGTTLSLVPLYTARGHYNFAQLDNTTEVDTKLTAMNAAVSSLVSSVSGLDRYAQLRAFNKYLIDNSVYNTTAASDRVYEIAWSPISALLSNNDASTGPVCHGYATAFKVLCDAAGIPCVIVEGNGFTAENTSEGHAWNYVQMEDSKWYAVDSTWNDTSAANATETYLLVGKKTETLTGTTSKNSFGANHVPGGKAYPSLEDNAYVGTKNIAFVSGIGYTSLQNAVTAADAASPVTLTDDVDLPATLTVDKEVTFLLQGHQIHNATNTTVTPLIQVNNGGKLTIDTNKNRNSNGDGADVLQKGTNLTAIQNNGTLVLQDGMLEAAGKTGVSVQGNSLTLGEHSVQVSVSTTTSSSQYVNIREVLMPVYAVTLQATASDIGDAKTVAALTTFVANKKPVLVPTYKNGGNVLNYGQPDWTTTATSTTSLVENQPYLYATNVYGYPLTLTVTYVKLALSGTVSVALPQGVTSAVVGTTLTANTTALVRPDGTGTLTYRWTRGNSDIAGATNATYTVQRDDSGESIFVHVSDSNHSGNVKSNAILVPKLIADPTLFSCAPALPATVSYNGAPQPVTVTANVGLTGLGAMTVTYLDSITNQPTTPKQAGTYTVMLSVAQTNMYAAASLNLGTYTIKAGTIYPILSGGNATIPSTNLAHEIRVDANFNDFVAVYVNDKLLETRNYTVRSGSVIVTFTQAYLSTLPSGVYNVTIAMNRGAAETQFIVPSTSTPTPTPPLTTPTAPAGPQAPQTASAAAMSAVPRTSDGVALGLLVALLLASACGLVAVMVLRRKCKADKTTPL